jgi:UPF0716 protein FxsA
MRLVAFFALVVLPAVEIFVIIQVAHAIGWVPTLAALLAAGLLGGYVMRRAGAAWWRALRGRFAVGGSVVAGAGPDGAAAARAALLFLAGMLLFAPGFLTDALGLLLLLPPARALLQAATAAWFVNRFTQVTGPGGSRLWTRRDRVVRGQVVRVDREPGGPGHDDPGADPPPPALGG